MATQVMVPKLGWEMKEAVLVEWLTGDGAPVVAGEPLYVIETDKVETTVEAPASGVIRITGVAGETYSVGHPIAEIE